MSWSISAIGKPGAVAAKVVRDTSMNRCNEPEESIKRAAVTAIVAALDSYPPNSVVRVTASGSQYVDNGVVKYNDLSVRVEPVHGFTE